MTELCRNVNYDKSSHYEWDQLNETTFLENVFNALRGEMGVKFNSYNWNILSSHDPDVVPMSAAGEADRKVLIFISDKSCSVPERLQKRYFAIFKCYLPYEMENTNIFSFNIGYVRDVPAFPVKQMRERDTSIFFSGNLNYNRFPLYSAVHPVLRHMPLSIAKYIVSKMASQLKLRREFDREVSNSYIHFSDGFKKGMEPKFYGRYLNDSRVVLCPKGFRSAETFRHIEAIRAGAVVISEPLPDTHFYRGAPIITVSDWRQGIRLARRMVNDLQALDVLQAKTVEWWREVCSERATAHYVAETLEKLEGMAPSHR